MWLDSKIEAGIEEVEVTPTVNPNQPRSAEGPIYDTTVKRLNLKNLKAKVVYPFFCEVCHSPIYFNLVFHRRLKTCTEITKKDMILFMLPLFFTVAFLGICINWVIQSGVNMYLILFYTLMWLPLFLITIAVGIWTFSKKDIYVHAIYSRAQIERK